MYNKKCKVCGVKFKDGDKVNMHDVYDDIRYSDIFNTGSVALEFAEDIIHEKCYSLPIWIEHKENQMKVDVTPTVITKESIEAIEEKYNCKYVFETSPIDSNGNRLCQTLTVFYCEEAHPEGSNYLGVFFKIDGAYLTDGLPHIADYYNCIEAQNGQIIYSRHRHDYRASDDDSVHIDGGQDYLKFSVSPSYETFDRTKHVKQFKIVDGEVQILEERDEQC